MESSIAEFLKRWFACERLPTLGCSVYNATLAHVRIELNHNRRPKIIEIAAQLCCWLHCTSKTILRFCESACVMQYPCGRGKSAISDA